MKRVGLGVHWQSQLTDHLSDLNLVTHGEGIGLLALCKTTLFAHNNSSMNVHQHVTVKIQISFQIFPLSFKLEYSLEHNTHHFSTTISEDELISRAALYL